MTDKRGTIITEGRVSIQQKLAQLSVVVAKQQVHCFEGHRTRVRPEYLITHHILTSDGESI